MGFNSGFKGLRKHPGEELVETLLFVDKQN